MVHADDYPTGSSVVITEITKRETSKAADIIRMLNGTGAFN